MLSLAVPTSLLILVILVVVFMALKELLEREIKAENFQGIVIRVGDQSEAHWWVPGETTIHRVLLKLEVVDLFLLIVVKVKLKFSKLKGL